MEIPSARLTYVSGILPYRGLSEWLKASVFLKTIDGYEPYCCLKHSATAKVNALYCKAYV